MWTSLLLVSVLGLPGLSGAEKHIAVSGAFEPAKGTSGKAAVAVRLVPHDPHDIKVNEEPAPRLELEPLQKILLDRQAPPPTKAQAFDPETARYLDPESPVRFPVALTPGAPKGFHDVGAQVKFFYCSKAQGWCRKGSVEIQVQVEVP